MVSDYSFMREFKGRGMITPPYNSFFLVISHIRLYPLAL
ncbi:hypothetical protein SAMN05428961_11348 [Paenibacillus sp. OK060]|nr:hypothetical protein SAMN05428961_11348 [Paenibacillus sp. OK060]